MTRSLVRFAFFALGACTHSSQSEPVGTDAVTFVESYGECYGNCYRELGISADGNAHIIVRVWRGEEIVLDRSVQLSDGETGRVLELAAGAASEPWAPYYGCPDCADQGAYSLVVRTSTVTQHTVLDPRDLPAAFDELVTTLRSVLRREIEGQI